MKEPDPARLEEGLRQLRELGYLSTPASAYVARRVGGGRSIARAVLASSFWIGGGTGWAFALLLTSSALLADPALFGWPRSLTLLFLELGVLLGVIFGLVTAVFATVVLLGRRRSASVRGSRVERAMVVLPALLATAYLVDRIGRSLLEGASASVWFTEALLLVLFAAFFAAVLSGAMRGALAMARLQLHGVFAPPRVTAREQRWPAAAGALLAMALLLAGPYRSGDQGAWFDEIEVPPASAAPPLLLVAIDGLSGPDPLSVLGPLQAGRSLPEAGLNPTAYWNEIATGFSASEHGLSSAKTTAPRGWVTGGERLRSDPVLSTLLTRLMPGVGLAAQQASDRRELRRPPLWEIAARAGVHARVINWWGTYPAERAPGLEVISDRQWLRHSAGAAADSLLASPPYLLLDAPEFENARLDYTGRIDSLRTGTAAAGVFELAATADLYHLRRATEAAMAEGPELVMVLLSGPDILARAGTSLTERVAWESVLIRQVQQIAAASGRELWLIAVGRDGAGAPTGSWGLGPWPARPEAAAAQVLLRLGILPAADMAGEEVVGAPPTYGLLRSGGDVQPRVAPDLEQLRSLGYIGN